MTQFNSSAAKKRVSTPGSLSTEVLVGLATAPMLLGLVAAKVLSDAVREAGQLSEEMFRGDRLPLLKIRPVDPSLVDLDTAD